MFPTRLNLLPPENQKYLQKTVFAEFIKNSLEAVLFLLCLAGMSLLGGQWILQGYFNELAESIVAVTQEQAVTNYQIKDVNKVIKQTKEIQDGYTLWTPILSELSNQIPDSIVLSNLTIKQKEKILIVRGMAETRDGLLKFQENLESLPFISSINIPLSQLTEKENIPFSLTTEIK
ncbi:PilN domain-containing protein [Patescibacteria group bacterium]|nr:PilN domain-containing protein [Patescibacteria group bacterium]